MRRSLIWELILNEFYPSHNAAETTRNICCAKGKTAFNYSNQMVKEILLGLPEPSQRVWPKTVDSEAMLEAIEANLLSSAQRISGELRISQSSLVSHLHNLNKCIWNCKLFLALPKYCKTFESLAYFLISNLLWTWFRQLSNSLLIKPAFFFFSFFNHVTSAYLFHFVRFTKRFTSSWQIVILILCLFFFFFFFFFFQLSLTLFHVSFRLLNS